MKRSRFSTDNLGHLSALTALFLSTALAFSFLVILPGRAATVITVTTTADALNTDGYCSLREAIIAANKDRASSSLPGECPAGSGTDTIMIPPGVYTLTRTDNGKEDSASTGDLDVTGDVTLIGNGPVTIDAVAGFKDRILHIISGNITLSGLTIRGGNPVGNGGGVLNLGALTLDSITLTGNKSGASGGGIYNAGILILRNVTISGNRARSNGGGLSNHGATALLNNVTVTRNTADSDNRSGGDGGGVFQGSSSLTLTNTILAGNLDASSDQKHPDCSGQLLSTGYNLIQNTTGCSLSGLQPGDLIGVDPLLAELSDNGGNSLTHALLPGSPAVDAGNPETPGGSTTACTTVDQRGISRPQGSACDIGAFELELSDPPQAGPIFTVNTTDDTDDGTCSLAHCSLREAIQAANLRVNTGSADEIHFSLPEDSDMVISPASLLPEISDPLRIDGFTQSPDGVVLDGSSAGEESDGLVLSSGGSTITGLTVQNFSANGLLILSGDGNQVTANVIQQNGGAGVRALSGVHNTLRGNLISQNGGLGIDLSQPGPDQNDAADSDSGTNNLQNYPVLLTAALQNGTITVLGRFNSTPESSFDLDFFSNEVCDPSNFGEGQVFLGSHAVTTNASGNAIDTQGNTYFTVTLTAPQTPTAFITAIATDSAGDTSEFSQCISLGEDNTNWVQASRLNLVESLPGFSSISIERVVDKLGQSRWFKFRVQPGSRVIVTLSNLSVNYDLTLYKDIAAAFDTLSSPQDLAQLGAEFAPDVFSPDVFSPDVFSPDNFSPDVFSPDVFSPDVFSPDVFSPDVFSPDVFSPDVFSPDVFSPDNFSPDVFSPDVFSPDVFSPDVFSPDVFSPDVFSSAQSRSVIAASGFDGITSEGIIVNTWENSGDFYVRVRGRNGAFDLQHPFRLQVLLLTGTCNTITTDLPASSLNPVASNYKTIVLTDFSRMQASEAEKSEVVAALQEFIARPEVAGVLVDVNADARVRAANSQADSHPACPFAKNLVARAIKELVDRYRLVNPLEYVVIIGDDQVIPFFRHPDQALLASEKNFVPPVRDNTSSQASLRLGYVLSQDDYGASRSLSIKDDTFPLPDLAIGRLVETPQEIITVLNAYLNTTDGVVPTPQSALVTGYDFLEDAALAVRDELTAGLGSSSQVDALITPRGISPSDPASWSAGDLRQLIFADRYDIAFLAAHFSAGSLLAADYRTRLLSSEIADTTINLNNSIIFSAGCHAGYNLVNPHGIPGISPEPDWAQAFARKGATLIAGTGYQYGDTDFIEYSERLYLEFTRQLRTGNGPVAVGKALNAAKQAYLAATPQLRGIHEKALLEATLFGLPMLAVNMPGQRLAPPSDPSIVNSTTLFTSDPGAFLGLEYTDISLQPPLNQHTVQLTDVAGGPVVSATYFSSTDGVVANPNEPVLPLVAVNVGVPGTVLRGVGFRGGDYHDLSDILPLTGSATTEVRGVHAPFPGQIFFPVRLWNPNYFSALLDQGETTRLALTPAQFRASGTDDPTGVLRLYDSLDLRLYYSANTSTYGSGSTPALSASPTISRVAAFPDEEAVRFFIQVVGDPAAGIQEVWVTLTATQGTFYGRWQSLDLVQNPDDSTLWEGSLDLNGVDPQDLRYFVQAVNGVGLVTMATNLGAYYIPGVETTPTTPTTLELSASNPTGAYGTEASFSAVLTSDGRPLSGMPVIFGLGAQSRVRTTDSAGRASVTMPLLALPGEISARASFPGSAIFAPSFDTQGITITKQTTLLVFDRQTESVQYSDQPLLQAVLTDAGGRRLGEKALFFILNGLTGSHTAINITDFVGRATLDPPPLPGGTYSVDGYFSGSIPLPGESLSLEDERYHPARASMSLEITAEDADVAYLGETLFQTGFPISFPVQVNQADDGMPGDLSRAQVRFDLRSELGELLISQTDSISPDGSGVFVLEAGLPPGVYQLDLTVVGGFFTSATTHVALRVNAPPTCTLAYASPDRAWPPEHQFVMVQVSGIADPDGDLPAILIEHIFQDERVGSGQHSPDGRGIGSGIAEVRAERDQNGNGRVYHIFFTASDGFGGMCSGEVLVGVPSDQGGQTEPIDDGALYDSTIRD